MLSCWDFILRVMEVTGVFRGKLPGVLTMSNPSSNFRESSLVGRGSDGMKVLPESSD